MSDLLRGDDRLRSVETADSVFSTEHVVSHLENDLLDYLSKGRGSQDNSVFRDLTKEERNRLRFGRGYTSTYEKIWGPRWGKALGLYLDLLPVLVREEVLSTLTRFGFWKITDETVIFKGLKKLSDLAKKSGALWSENWKYFVNLETFGGFKEAVDIDEFVDDIKSWVTGTVVHKSLSPDGSWSEAQFFEDLRVGIREFLSDLPNQAIANSTAPDLELFCYDVGYWAGSGASQVQGSVEVRLPDGSVSKTRKNKWRTSLLWRPEDVKNALFSKEPQFNKAIQKRERGKVRAVINADDASYLQMSFISTWLEVALQGSTKSTLYMNKQQTVDMWDRLASNFASGVRLPLDQSHFDWQQNSAMINVFLDVVEEIVNSAPHADEYLQVLASLREKLSKGYVKVGNSLVAIEKGIMSGWRWTALMDTAFNWAELYAAKKLCERAGVPVTLLSVNAQGDDDQLTVSSKVQAAALVAAYSMMNFEINPSKFFIDARRDEYLRQVVEPDLVAGYPARSIGAVLYRTPLSFDPPPGILRAREQVANWNILAGRGCDQERVFHYMRQDIVAGNGLSSLQFGRLAATPSSLGGLGLSNGDSLVLNEGIVERQGSIVGRPPGTRAFRAPGWWTPDDEVQAFRPNLETVKNSLSFSDGFVEELGWAYRNVRFPYDERTAIKFPLSANFDRLKIPGMYSSALLDKAITARDWAWIEAEWLDSSSRLYSDIIKNRCSRRIWIDWLRGDLPFSIPVVWGYSQLVVSATFDLVVGAAILNVLQRSNGCTYDTLRNAAIQCEDRVRHLVLSRPVRHGG